MRSIKLLSSLLMISITPLFINAQQVNTLYFMKDVPVRHFLNPSFQPETDFYLSLPVIGFTQFNVGNNSLSLKDVIYNDATGNTISFLNSNGNTLRFYNSLNANTLFRVDLQTNLLSFGFRHETAYWTFSLTEKTDGTVNVPKDLFQLSLFGTQSLQNNSFDFTKLQGDISMYTEAALGYSKQLNETWTVGGKLKLLIGSSNLSNSNNQLLVNASSTQWSVKGQGTIRYSGPVQISASNNNQSFSFTTPTNTAAWLKPYGMGAGIDAGFEYRINNRMKLSGSLNDLGFIHWSKNTQNYQYQVNSIFKGIKLFDNNSTNQTFQDVYNRLVSSNALVDSMVTAFKSSSGSKMSPNSYTTYTTAKLNIGFEYSLFKDKLSFGILSYSQLFKNIPIEELTGSVNTRPFAWLDASLSYSVFNGRMSTLGAGIGLKTGLLHWFVAADYIPFEKATLSLSDLGTNYPKINIPIPYNSRCFNLSVGMNIVMNKKEKENKFIKKPKNSSSLNLQNGLHQWDNGKDCNCD